MKHTLRLLLLAGLIHNANAQGIFTLGKQVVPPTGFDAAYNFKITQVAGTYDAPGLGNGQYCVRYPHNLDANGLPIPPVAVDVFIGGHGGQAYWTQQESVNTAVLFNTLAASNHVVVQLKFTNTGWFGAPTGQRWGFKTQSARVAVAFKYLHDAFVLPMQVIGGSGGSAAIGYAISFWDADQYMKRAVMISGPPFALQDEGCTQVAGYQYAGDATALVDVANGYPNNATFRPCTQHSTDPAWIDYWNQDSVEIGGRYLYPNTQIDFIEGAKDSPTEIKVRENTFFNLIAGGGQQTLSFQLIADMGHNVQKSATAMQYLTNLLLTP